MGSDRFVGTLCDYAHGSQRLQKDLARDRYKSLVNPMSKFASAVTPAVRVTLVSAVLNVVLAVAKVFVGLLVGSHALVADGMHSLSDLASDAAVLSGLWISTKAVDANHPFGHHKYATLARFLVGCVLVISAVLIVFSAVMATHDGEVSITPSWIAVGVATVGLLVKEALFWWTNLWAKRLRSELLKANAWHHRTDSASSVVVLCSLLTVQFGGPEWAFLDSVVAVALGGYLVFIGAKIMHSAFADLMDQAPEAKIIEDLREHILPIEGVLGYHQLRVRRIGDVMEMDVHIQVDPTITVDAGHDIAKAVKKHMMQVHPEVFHILVHVEPATAEHLKPQGLHDLGDNTQK
jgi:cation diffusion facilitator family transporter